MGFVDTLLDPAVRPQVVAALAETADQEVAAKSGLSGMAIKGAYASAKKMKEGIVAKGINAMLPEIAETLAPYWESRGDKDFAAHLGANAGPVADQLLAVADAKAAQPENAALAKLYKPLRGKAKEHVEQALPRLAATVEQFVA